jgi:hypothetical protein
MVQGLQTKTGDFGVPAPESPRLPFSGTQRLPLGGTNKAGQPVVGE